MADTTRQLLAALHPLLDRALDLGPVERAAWLAELRATHPGLVPELEGLLGSEAELDARRFLEADAWSDIGRPARLAGRRVGAYTLDRLLGQGGMGTVWLARRSDGRYEGRAAVKLLNLALLDPVGSERFRREGTVLARLTHPNIARLVDAGVADDGQPFLVLEHVEGRRIDRYCDDEALPPDRRLGLFLQVLEAVGHAHANLIVHRDIKPSNILVGPDGSVKLLDFGIAKLLETETAAAERSALTDLGGIALTPEYAAPEQALGGPVTTATDVYALGVLLYVLLAGRHPTGEGCRSAAEHLRAVTDTEPPRLSVAVTPGGSRTPADLSRAAAARGVTGDRLRRLYLGDLDNIVAKALKKRPEERYGTVAAFADDLTRYLRHQPIAARPDSVGYRVGKFVRRNRTAVILASVAALALLAGLAGTLTQARRATREAELAAGQRDRADRETRTAETQRDFALRQVSRAEAVNDLNTFLLSDAAPSGKAFTVGDLIARAESIVEREDGESDANRVEMLASIGAQYVTQDEDAKALRVLTRAYDLSRALADRSTRSRAACGLAKEVARSGDLKRAEDLISEGLAQLPPEPQFALDRVACLSIGSYVAREGGDGRAGVARIEAARSALAEVRFPTAVLTTRLLMDLAESYRMADRERDADSVFQEAFLRLKSLGRANTETAGTLLNNWALTLDEMGQPLKAEPLYRKAIRISSAIGGAKHVSPMLFRNLAGTLDVLARLPDAAHYAELAYSQAQEAGNQIVINQSLLVRARIYRERGDLKRADAALAEVEPRLERALPPGHYAFASVELERGLLAQARGDFRSALAAADHAIAIVEHAKQGGYALPLMLVRRARLEIEMHRFTDAERDAARGLELQKEIAQRGAPSQKVGMAYLTLGRAFRGEGQVGKAQAAFASALAQLRPTLGSGHPQTRLAAELASEGLPR